jgi:hypothetical protein
MITMKETPGIKKKMVLFSLIVHPSPISNDIRIASAMVSMEETLRGQQKGSLLFI